MSEIVVHRCVVRIRRTSGWAWGAPAEELVQAATRALPTILAARLPALADAIATPLRITRPVQVKFATTVAELVALRDPTSGHHAAALAERIAAEVARAVEHAIEREDGIERAASSAPSVAEAEPPAAATGSDLDPRDADAPRRAVRAWWRGGAIDQVLARLAPAALLRLHDLLLPPAPAGEVARAELLAIAEAIDTRLRLARASEVDRATVRIVIAAALADAFPAVHDRAIAAAVEHVIPRHATAAVTTRADDVESRVDVAVHAPRPAATTRTIEIRSVLPFLLLPSLYHARWLDTATTLLAAHELEDLAFALGVGLAAKVVEPPVRRWARSPADRAVIAAFVGSDESIEDGALASAAAHLEPILDALDASLLAVLARARRPRPLVLARDELAWLLLDTSGMTVIGRHRELRPALATAHAAPILVSAALADPATLEALDLANRRFITDAPPTRGEAWRRIRGLAQSFATNDTQTPTAQLVALTADFDLTLALAGELVETLAERPVLPRAPLVRLDATCALAATAALADLGARLFPAEATTPVLALARFRDLDAVVTFEPERIRVRVPLGRRHADLMRHGVLGQIARIPWLHGRTLELGGA